MVNKTGDRRPARPFKSGKPARPAGFSRPETVTESAGRTARAETERKDQGELVEMNSDRGPEAPRRPRVCMVANFHSPTFSGRVASELLVASRGVELAVAASERQSYLYQKEFVISPFVDKVLGRPDTGRYRLWTMPLFAMPTEIEQGEFWALTAFDAMYPDGKAIRKLKGLPVVWVPSETHAAACRKAGISAAALRVFPLPVNQRTFHPRVPCPSRLAPEKGVFRFIVSGSPLKRKGIEDVLQAYIKEFKPEEKVELVVKLTHLPKIKKDFDYEISDFRKKFGALNRMFAKVTLVAETLSDHDYAGLLASADAFVSGNLSYNSAINVKEAMACALPVIGADYLSDLAGLTPECGFLVPAHEADFAAGELYVNSPACRVKKLDAGKLAAAMREAFTCNNKARKMGLVGQRQLKTRPDWKSFAADLMNVAVTRFRSQEPQSAE